MCRRWKSSCSRSLGAIDVTRPEPLAHLDQHGEAGVAGDLPGEPRPRARDVVLLEEAVGEVLVAHRAAHRGARRENERRRELVTCGRDDLLVEIGERNDEAHVVLGDERGERGHVAGVVDPRDERGMVGVIERGRERVEVGGDRRRAGAAERAHDVDALPCAGEEDGCHPTAEGSWVRHAGFRHSYQQSYIALALRRRGRVWPLPYVDDAPANVDAELDVPPFGPEVRVGELRCFFVRLRDQDVYAVALHAGRESATTRSSRDGVGSDRTRPGGASPGGGTSRSARAPLAGHSRGG